MEIINETTLFESDALGFEINKKDYSLGYFVLKIRNGGESYKLIESESVSYSTQNQLWLINDEYRGIIDFNYNLVIPANKYTWISIFFPNGKAVVGVNDKYGLINTKGEEITEIKYNKNEIDKMLK